MNLIAAVDTHWGIGANGDLLFHIQDDMLYFRKMTTNKVIVMGRKTLESFPGRKPLKNRINIVFSRDQNYKPEGVVVVHNLDELNELLQGYNSDDVFVIGGGAIYAILEPLCTTAFVTKIKAHKVGADTFFPDLDANKHWALASQSELYMHNEIGFQFCQYNRIQT